jgi:hypothetical protein
MPMPRLLGGHSLPRFTFTCFPLACIKACIVLLVHALCFSLSSITSFVFHTSGSAHRAFLLLFEAQWAWRVRQEMCMCTVLSSGLRRVIPGRLKEMLQKTCCWELASMVGTVSMHFNVKVVQRSNDRCVPYTRTP